MRSPRNPGDLPAEFAQVTGVTGNTLTVSAASVVFPHTRIAGSLAAARAVRSGRWERVSILVPGAPACPSSSTDASVLGCAYLAQGFGHGV